MKYLIKLFFCCILFSCKEEIHPKRQLEIYTNSRIEFTEVGLSLEKLKEVDTEGFRRLYKCLTPLNQNSQPVDGDTVYLKYRVAGEPLTIKVILVEEDNSLYYYFVDQWYKGGSKQSFLQELKKLNIGNLSSEMSLSQKTKKSL